MIAANPDVHTLVSDCINHHRENLAKICAQIHENPEIRYEEYKAHDNICNLLEELGYQVKRHTYGLDTSFEVEYGKGGRLIVFNAEYDALPELGHACGHNLIATSSIAAFIATAETLRTTGVEGRVRLLGTPAEETGGGKLKLINAGAYKGVDACLMAHPDKSTMRDAGSPGTIDGIAAATTFARKQVHVTFKGQNAHAGLSPWEGRNALDAVVASYVNISLLRQQLPPTARVHGCIRQGGKEPNIIPDNTTLEYLVRDTKASTVADLAARVERCFHAGAQATGTEVEVQWIDEGNYMDLVPNMTLCKLFTDHMSSLGKTYKLDARSQPLGASTDMGNVCHEVPGFHCTFSVGEEGPSAGPHSPAFAIAAGTKTAFLNAIECAKGMAMTGYDILANDEHAREMKENWEQDMKN